MNKKILIATGNQGKFIEITNYFKDLTTEYKIEFLNLKNFKNIPEVIEDGKTLEENAIKKALEIFRQTNIPTLADDTGLEVDFLNGEPGVYSARYAGENASFDDNILKLLNNLGNVPFEKRTAKFSTVIAFVLSEKEIILAKGICEGFILDKKIGNSGFGYDPIFFLKPLNKTFAEMTLDEKNQISHRALALKNIKEKILNQYLNK